MNITELISLTTAQTQPSTVVSQTQDELQSSFTDEEVQIGTATETVSGIDSLTGVSGADGDVSAQAEEFTTFLTLLTAQIRNQDPLAPLDSTQFVDQLATFSSLELQAEGNQTLENIASLLASQAYNTDPVSDA